MGRPPSPCYPYPYPSPTPTPTPTLVPQKNADAAINHYTEAGAYVKAIEAAISCRQVRYLVITPTMVRPSAAVRYLVSGESRERCAAYVP